MDLASPWLSLTIGILLIVTPVQALFVSNIKFRSVENLEISLRNRSWWRVWRRVLFMPCHWIELGRSFLGMKYIVNSLELMQARGTCAGFSSAWMVGGVALGTGTLAVCLMLVAFRRTEGVIAPVAFISAAVFAVMPIEVAGLALILAISAMIAFKSLSAFFAMLALGLAGLGVLFGQVIIAAAFGAGLSAMPLLVALLIKRELVIPVRQSH